MEKPERTFWPTQYFLLLLGCHLSDHAAGHMWPCDKEWALLGGEVRSPTSSLSCVSYQLSFSKGAIGWGVGGGKVVTRMFFQGTCPH